MINEMSQFAFIIRVSAVAFVGPCCFCHVSCGLKSVVLCWKCTWNVGPIMTLCLGNAELYC